MLMSVFLPALVASVFSNVATALPAITPRQASIDWYFTLFDNDVCELTTYRYWEGTGSKACTAIPYSGINFSKQVLADNCVVNFYTDVECQQYYTDLTSEYPEIGVCGHFEQMPYSFLVYCS